MPLDLYILLTNSRLARAPDAGQSARHYLVTVMGLPTLSMMQFEQLIILIDFLRSTT